MIMNLKNNNYKMFNRKKKALLENKKLKNKINKIQDFNNK